MLLNIFAAFATFALFSLTSNACAVSHPPPVPLPSSKPRLVKGVDTANLIPKDMWHEIYKAGFTHAVLRGYQEAWGLTPGGRVDPNFLANYRNAKAAKLTVDAFWFPCSGKQHHCKPYDRQVHELMAFIKKNHMQLNRIWIDIEIDVSAANWDYGRDSANQQESNLIEAKKMAEALKAVYPNYGLYSTPGEWFNIFGAFDPVVDDNTPLWWGTWDDKKGYDDMMNPQPRFGGWSSDKIVGKQYTDNSASDLPKNTARLFNLDVFLHP